MLEELGADTHVIFAIDAPRVEAEELRAAADNEEEALIVDDRARLERARLDADGGKGGRAAAAGDRPGALLLLRPGHGCKPDLGSRNRSRLVGPAVVPKPVSLTPGTGAFVVRASTRVSVSPATPETARIAAALAGFLSADVGPAPAPVTLELGGPSSLGAEGYDLTVTPKTVRLVAHEPAGLFYGVQTVRQLLGTGKRLPSVRIRDRPRFAWRGAMLDVARHFFASTTSSGTST